jgi:3,4-dihydroxy 2-butanone 4-phosphate synthase/GTP cyclohydrolase II
MSICSVEQAIEDFRSGKFVIIADDENRENEGDLALAAQHITPEAINFMARFARGLICTPMESRLLDRLEIPMMVPPHHNNSGFGTGFTVSVEARKGVTTGISAFDRARTIQVLADPSTQPGDLVMPGHTFPLRAQPGGVLVRRGQTEASVDLAALAGLTPAAVICEVLSRDGTMARMPELHRFGVEHGISILTVEDLFLYRSKTCPLEAAGGQPGSGLTKSGESILQTDYGAFRAVAYKDLINSEEHLALYMGDIRSGSPLVRIHSCCLTGDVFGSHRCDCGGQLHLALKRIAQAGAGVLIYLKQEGRGIGLANKIRAYALQDQGLDTVDANLELGFNADMRSYAGAAGILKDLGIESLRLMTNNPNKMEALERSNLRVIERIPHEIQAQACNRAYLQTKAERLGHLLRAGT